MLLEKLRIALIINDLSDNFYSETCQSYQFFRLFCHWQRNSKQIFNQIEKFGLKFNI